MFQNFLFFFWGGVSRYIQLINHTSWVCPLLYLCSQQTHIETQPLGTETRTGSNAHELKMEKQLILIYFLSSNDNEWSRLLLLYRGMSVFSICWCLGVIIWTFHYFLFWRWSFLKENMWRGNLKKKKSDTVRLFLTISNWVMNSISFPRESI